ncbi:hypothetical protein MKZ38_002924 [Zalerion maritima]|uniref:F-box domain-containing protein n=1 Tax=Zalerion maritima TaxID=339359 RepID=A0AAD5RP10_9PEZI|nr:hypothetical protein MKZ38_002924 [Zalerion maritima]
MAACPPPRSWRTSSLDDLSSELLALTFEKLRELERASLVNVRLVSRRFDAIALPIQYRTIHLNDRILSSDGGCSPQALEHLYANTRHVVAGSNLNPDRIRTILGKIRRLESLRWRYATSSLGQNSLFLPSDILSPTQTSIRLEVEDLPLRDFTASYTPDTYTRAIPPELLVSLKMATPIPPLTTKLESLKNLIVESCRLETLHYADRGQGTRFSFLPGERMPLLKELSMKCYDWNHDPENVREHWNFSRLESLELHSVPLFPFLSSVDFYSFGNLRELRLDDYSAHIADNRDEATALLHRLVRDHLADLRVLCVTVRTRLFPLDAVAKHGETLVELRLRDHVGFGEDDRRCPTLWADDLLTLSSFLTNVKKLELDMDTALCDPPAFLRALCRFRKLDELTLHVQTVLHPLEIVHPGVDRDREASMRTFSFLKRGREELLGIGPNSAPSTAGAGGLVNSSMREMNTSLRSPRPDSDVIPGAGTVLAGARVRKTPDPFRGQRRPAVAYPSTPDSVTAPWKSVTLNVGGWRRIMVRRLGDGWRQQNENGVYAERCFVMERSPYGELMVREERCVESWDALNNSISNAGTP